MSVFKLAYNFNCVQSAPRRVDVVASTLPEAVNKLTQQLWWDCIDSSEVVINCVGKAPA